MIGSKFSRWVVVSEGENYVYPKSGRSTLRYNCLCICGTEKLVHKAHLLNSSSTSCGCYNREVSTTHGKSKTREYTAYMSMCRRVSGVSTKDNKYYLEKDVKVCERWLDVDLGLSNFLVDMGSCPEGFELDREDSGRDYEPTNCRWVSEQVQSENRGDYLNNTSGKKGVGLVKNYLKDGSENFYWRAFRDVGYKRETKNFSVNKLGCDIAYQGAVFWREHLEQI